MVAASNDVSVRSNNPRASHLLRALRVPWTARRSHQSILQEIDPEYSLEGLVLKHGPFGPLMQRADSLEKP